MGAHSSIIHRILKRVGWDWTSLTKTTRFDVPGDGEAPYEARQVATHKRIVTVGKLFAAVGLLPGIGIGIAAVITGLQSFTAGDLRMGAISFVFGVPFAIAPVGFYFYGASMGLLFSPATFLGGPIGKKWLKIAGVKSAVAARVLCLLLFMFSFAIICFLLALIWIPIESITSALPI